MYVEKLSLFGFKSFHEKVSLEFGPGISGVIGPNGAGKSNIVDAVRWVLGEQSTKQLRGAKMEDVIFHGTRDEKPLSLAEVTLTINNERGTLPIDYGTVTVGRRLYRSGVSEYTINKQPVRLKDVRELFLDTGMGSHAYSVIERQMVENILSDTTGHRRFLFEEAAGIMKYKTRKKEALNKLEATERDLVRVNDIITEVERQVGSLKRQVSKARRYRALRDEIRGIDLAWSQLQRRRWMDQIAVLEKRFREAADKAEEGEARVATIEAELQTLQLAVLEEERRLKEAREELARIDDAIGKANSEIMVLRERLDGKRKKILAARELQVRLSDRLERNAASMEEVKSRAADLAARETEEKERLEREEAVLSRVEERLQEQRDRVAEERRRANELREERIRAEGEVESAGRRRAELEARIETLAARLAEAETARETSVAAWNGAVEAVSRAREELARREQAHREAAERGREQDRKLEESRRTLAEGRQAKAAAESRLQTLEALRREYEGFSPGVRALVREETRAEGVVGVLGELLQVPEEWAAALEPALGPVWQYVVVRDGAVARGLLQRLVEESLGFAALLPLDRVPESEVPPPDVTRASEVVQTAPEYRNLVRALFGDLALAETLEEAVALVEQGRARRAVARSGEYVDGMVLAAGKGGPAGGELLEREESLKRCRRDIENVAETLAVASQREQELAAAYAQWQREVEEADRAVEAARSSLSALQTEEMRLRLEASHAEEAAAKLAREREEAKEQAEVLREKQATQEQRLVRLREEESEAEKTLAASTERLAAAEAEREKTLGGVYSLRLSWSRLEGELRDARSAAQRLAEEEADLRAERERTAQDEKENTVEVAEIERRLEELADQVEQLHREREQKAAVVAEREHAKAEVTAREQQDTETLREVRRKASVERQAAHEAELELSRLQGEVKHLEERLVQEYDVVPADLDEAEGKEIPEDAPRVLAEMKERLRRMGDVNPLAVEEYEEKKNRFEFMSTQRDDLVRARDSLLKTINQINGTASRMFLDTFSQVQENFQKTFQVLFQGGECALTLTGDDPLEADIDVVARPRGKKPQSIHQLSSGERALTAIALLFAIYLVKPSPFCILDEVDAPLDDANVDRFVAMVKEFSQRTQFIVITHNKKTMAAADCLYGVTMQKPGVSTVVSVRFDKLGEEFEETRPAARSAGGNGGGNGSGVESEEPPSPESVIVQ